MWGLEIIRWLDGLKLCNAFIIKMHHKMITRQYEMIHGPKTKGKSITPSIAVAKWHKIYGNCVRYSIKHVISDVNV